MSNKTMSVKDYEVVLTTHDWTYQMSEDSWAYRSGINSAMKIRQHRNDSPKHSELYLKHYKSVEM